MKNSKSKWATINYIKGISSGIIKSGTPIIIKSKGRYNLFSYIKSLHQNKYRILKIYVTNTNIGTQYIPKLNLLCLKPIEDNYSFQCATPVNTYRASFNRTYTINSHFIYINLITCGIGVCTYTIKYRVMLNNVWFNWVDIYNKHNGGNTDFEDNNIVLTIDNTLKAYKDTTYKVEISVYMDSWYEYNFATTSISIKGKRYTEIEDTTSGELHYVLIEQ